MTLCGLRQCLFVILMQNLFFLLRELLEALLIVLAGLVLITPGFLTDAIGFMLLIPATRVHVSDCLRNRFQAKFTRKNDDDIIIQQ